MALTSLPCEPNYGHNVVRVDLRGEKPTVEMIAQRPQSNIEVPVIKHRRQADFRYACMDGETHPMQIEREHYVLVKIHVQSIDTSVAAQHADPYSKYTPFSPAEMDFIESVQQRPEIEWAVDNSFDGIYIQKFDDYARGATSFEFAVYMKEEQVTFWKLKYSGR